MSSHICSHSLFSGLSPPSDSPVGGSDSVFTKFALLSFLPILLPDLVFLSSILVPFDFLTTFILCAKLTNNQTNNNNSCMRMFKTKAVVASSPISKVLQLWLYQDSKTMSVPLALSDFKNNVGPLSRARDLNMSQERF